MFGINTMIRLNPFRSGRCLSTVAGLSIVESWAVSIPFDQGDVFRRIRIILIINKKVVSIPFDQGDVFRHFIEEGK